MQADTRGHCRDVPAKLCVMPPDQPSADKVAMGRRLLSIVIIISTNAFATPALSQVAAAPAVASPQQTATIPAGTARIAGFVFDDMTNRPLEGVEVRLDGAANPRIPFSASTKVDSKGHFEFAKLPDGSYSVLVGARGYSGECYGLTVVDGSRQCGVLAGRRTR